MNRVSELLKEKPWLASILIGLAFLPLKLFGFETSYLNIHAARDWERGWQIMHGTYFWSHGAELLFGGSTPGFFWNLLCGLFQIPHRNPMLAAALPPMMFCASIMLFHDTVRRFYPCLVALVASLIYGTFPLGTVALRYLWNPSHLFFFGALTMWFVARAVRETRPNFLAGAMLSTLLAAQVHFSGYSQFAALLLMMACARMRPSWKWILIVLGIHFAFITPYFVTQQQAGWPDRNFAIFNKLIGDVELARFKPVGNFPYAISLQFLVQHPDMPQTFPFSYFEKFYRDCPVAVRLFGEFCHVISWGLLGLFLGGVIAAFSRAIGRGLNEDELAARRFVRLCLILIAIVCVPVLLWNPALGAAKKTDHPIRYYFIMWPAQFHLMAWGLHLFTRNLRAGFLRRLLWALIGLILVSNTMYTIFFAQQARRTGQPFQYLAYKDWFMHGVGDKVAVANYIVTEFGMNTELFLTRVHSDYLVFQAEESLDFEMRSAMENHPDAPQPDPSLYFFIYEPKDRPFIAGEFERVAEAEFRSLAVLVYRPDHPVPDWQLDPPIGWWWY